MTTLLHTADVHLRSDAPERRAALATLLDRADEIDADVVTVAGDLFDTPGDVESIRPELRNDLFRDRSFEILLIPGNHDERAFRDDVFFGDACTSVTTDPFEHWTAPDGDLRITALPYRERPDDDLLLALQDRETFEGSEALLLHCSLDAPVGTATGEDERAQYFPVSEDLLVELGFDYYLAGHYHGHHLLSFADGSEFAYPGTPASTSIDETGPRRVCRLDTEDGLDVVTLETFHYRSREWTVVPGREERVLDAIRSWVAASAAPAADVSIVVDGFVEMDEASFQAALGDAVEAAIDESETLDRAGGGTVDVENRTRSVGHVHAHPLYEDFEAELAETDWDEATRSAVRERVLEVFSDLAVRGEL